MKLSERIKWRWNNARIELPGELEPTENGASIIYFSEIEDQEKHIFLQRLKSVLLGYGPGWTFWTAFRDKFILWPFRWWEWGR